MNIRAHVENREGVHLVTLSANQNVHSIEIPPRATGFG